MQLQTLSQRVRRHSDCGQGLMCLLNQFWHPACIDWWNELNELVFLDYIDACKWLLQSVDCQPVNRGSNQCTQVEDKKNWIFKCVCVLNLQVRTKTAQQCVEFFYLDKKLHEKREKQKQENQVGGLEQQTGVRTPFFHFFLSNSVVPPFQTIWNNSINRSRGEPTMKEPERTPIPNGVPQRPVLGPVLYHSSMKNLISEIIFKYSNSPSNFIS